MITPTSGQDCPVCTALLFLTCLWDLVGLYKGLLPKEIMVPDANDTINHFDRPFRRSKNKSSSQKTRRFFVSQNDCRLQVAVLHFACRVS